MSQSTQHKLDRIRPPRVQITYDVEIGNAIEVRELPFIVGILADLSGHRLEELPKMKNRKFVEIDRDNINDIMDSIRPRVELKVPDIIGNKPDSKIALELVFTNMDDFSPMAIIRQSEEITDYYERRVRINDLQGKLDGNDELFEALQKMMTDSGHADTLRGEMDGDDVGSTTSEVIDQAHMIKDESQRAGAAAMLGEFLAQIQGDEDVGDNPLVFIARKLSDMDQKLSLQMDEVLHNPEFQKLEGSWRGLSYLVMNTETGEKLKLRLLNASKGEVLKDLENAVEFDQSQLFKKVYEEEYGTFGGSPFSCLMADFKFGRGLQDMILLEKLSNVASAAHTPLICAADPKLFDMDSFTELGVPRDLKKVFESTELIKWRSFREMEDSRYITLTLPHVLMRFPYGPDGVPVEEFPYTETVDGADNSKFCWGNAAYTLTQRITNAFALYKWTAAIRGVEGGGLVEGLPAYTFKTTDGDIALKCPTEIAITDRREKELSDLGFLSLCHAKGTDYAAFFGAQTAQKPKVYNLDEANANAQLSARLTYMLAASRFAHYIKVIMRDKIGTFMTKDNVSDYLNTWIAQYILISDDAPQNVKASYPLREARIDVSDVPGQPGKYRATVFLRPHFQMEELTASIRLVATLPPPAA